MCPCLGLSNTWLVTFMKYLASVVALTFPQKFLVWNKIMFSISKLLKLAELVVNQLMKSFSKRSYQYSFFVSFITT